MSQRARGVARSGFSSGSAPKLGRPRTNYWTLSTRPLHILVFLLPLVLIYEIGSAVHFAGSAPGEHETVVAYRLIYDIFGLFGVSGLYLPGFLIVAVLLVWHLLTRDSWQVNAGVLAGMTIEAILWTLPLLVVGQIANRLVTGSPAPEAAVLAAELHAQPWTARAILAIGAGVYEELVFRMVLIAAVHLLVVDLMGSREFAGRAIAIGAAALAFALYHDVRATGGGIDGWRLIFYFSAGVFFGGLYVWRGFGIVVATHALYDLAVLVLLRPPAS
ncbi:MAG: CPBP family intramembrane metalloprotease [Phycisphaerales bacterium]|nr:CPBP family intramembrane metalloprotease [Phycisphaerales bacterium]